MSSAEATLCAQLPREAQKTLYSVLSRVALPSEADEKYRTLKLDNAALQQRLLRHAGALELLALCRFELRGRTLVLPADASADAIHRALDAITAAAAPAASVPPAAPPAVPVATAPTPPPPPRREGATAGASPEEIQARAEKRRRAAEADAAARALERRRWAADSAARRDRQAPAATRQRAAAPPPPPPGTPRASACACLQPPARRPEPSPSPWHMTRRSTRCGGRSRRRAWRAPSRSCGRCRTASSTRSSLWRASLATLGLDDGLTLVAMPADARGRVVRGSVSQRWAMLKETPLMWMTWTTRNSLNSKSASARRLMSGRGGGGGARGDDDLRHLRRPARRGAPPAGGDARAVCGVHGGHRRVGDVLRPGGDVPLHAHEEALRGGWRRTRSAPSAATV